MRIIKKDENHISVHVLSNSLVQMVGPDKAAELKRCVTQLDFVGAQISKSIKKKGFNYMSLNKRQMKVVSDELY